MFEEHLSVYKEIVITSLFLLCVCEDTLQAVRN